MQGVRVVRIHRKRLLAADLRVEISLASHMAKAGLTESGRRLDA